MIADNNIYGFIRKMSGLCPAILRSMALLLLLLFSVGLGNVKAVEPYDTIWSNRAVETEEVTREEMHIRFVVAKNKIERWYMNNAATLDSIVRWVDKVSNDEMVEIVSVEFCGAVSPEGSVRFNHWLSVARLTALEKYVRERIEIPEELIVRNDHYIAWNELDSMVENSDMHNKEEILRIVRSENRSTGEQLDSRIGELKKLENGKTWRILLNTFFREMRNAYVVIVTKKSQYAIMQEYLHAAKPKLDFMPVEEPKPMLSPIVSKVDCASPHYMHVKTNLVGLAMLNANIGVEFDLGNHLSLNLPVSYSALDYFKTTVKFRNFSVQPELRYWPKTNYKGLFVGAHMGFAYYNFAFDGDWRYQDHKGKSPTLGGGLSVGYRLPISRDGCWNMEFAMGAGVYPLHYDRFHNVKDVSDGQLFDTRKKTYIGLDNIYIGISYRIPVVKGRPTRVRIIQDALINK